MMGLLLRRVITLGLAVRTGEALLMLGFPVTAGVLGISPAKLGTVRSLAAVMVASVLLSISIYAFNTAAGFPYDRNDAKFSNNPLHLGWVQPRSLYSLTAAGSVAGFLVLAAWAARLLPAVVILWAIWLLYSHPQGLKRIPGAASAAHVAAGALMFLVPYVVARRLDPRGIVLALFFGLILASGHANHEAIDEPADRRAGIGTLAVRNGRSSALTLNLVLAGVAYTLLAGGALTGTIEPAVTFPFLAAGVPHLVAGAIVLRSTLTTRALRLYRRRYRVLFAVASLTSCGLHLVGSGIL